MLLQSIVKLRKGHAWQCIGIKQEWRIAISSPPQPEVTMTSMSSFSDPAYDFMQQVSTALTSITNVRGKLVPNDEPNLAVKMSCPITTTVTMSQHSHPQATQVTWRKSPAFNAWIKHASENVEQTLKKCDTLQVPELYHILNLLMCVCSHMSGRHGSELHPS